MKKLSKRILSILLSILMVVSILPAGTVAVQAKTTKADEVIAAARAELGWYKSDANKFTKWWGCTTAWCAIFVCYCANQAGVLNSAIPKESVCVNMMKFFKDKKQYYTVGSGYVPQKGDVVFFDTRGTGTAGHVEYIAESGYVVSGSIKKIKCIGGNTSDQSGRQDSVAEKYRDINYASCKVIGYGHPSYPDSYYDIKNKSVTNQSNTSATIGFTVSPNATPSKWGFYIDTNQSKVSNNSATKKTVNSGTSCDVAKYAGDLKPNTTYYYKIWTEIGGKTWCSSVANFKTKNDNPGTPKISVSNSDIGINGKPTVTWKTVSNVTTYTAKLFDSNGNTVQAKTNIASNATSFTFDPIKAAGTYKAYIYSVNVAGTTTGTPAATITVHPDVTVRFEDAEPTSFVDYQSGDSTQATILGEYTIHYGESVIAPEVPEHKGYTFSSWSGTYKNVKSDSVVRATYKINQYTVNFLDRSGKVISSEKVNYCGNATPPTETNPPRNYIFYGWDSEDYLNVYTDAANKVISVRGIYKWENEDLPIVTTITSAQRQDDGYTVRFNLENYPNAKTRGRAVVSLKTASGTLLATTESAAFSIDKEGTKNGMEVFVPSDEVATRLEVLVIDDYSSGVPISRAVSSEIDQELMWSNWSTQVPEQSDDIDVETKTQYRYREKEFSTGNTNVKSGWTYAGTYSSKVGSWSGWQDSSISAVAFKLGNSSSKEVGTQTVDVYGDVWYYYYHHYYNPTGGSHVYCPTHHDKEGSNNESGKWTFHSYNSKTKLTKIGTSSDAGYKTTEKYQGTACSKCGATDYWFFNSSSPGDYKREKTGTKKQYRSRETTYTYNFYRWKSWSTWADETVTANSNREVETQQVYRFKSRDVAVEDDCGISHTVAGELGTDCAGKQITLYVYGYTGASDYTNQYIGQSTVAQDGTYSFTFKLREEPTVESGDYTVAIGLEGTTDLVVVDTIEAPRPTYTVIFYDFEGNIISTQTVYEGENAELPENPTREGYDFIGWDNTTTNITEDIELNPEFKKKEFTVVFVDWEARNVAIEKFEYGDVLTAPDFEIPDEGTNVVWDKIAQGVTEVTEDMVICTEYTAKTYDVVFRDFEGNIISEQTVNYGYAADVPELDTDEDKIFLDWQTTDTYENIEDYIVTSKIDVCPKYVFAETCETPEADIESGEYSSAQTITLTTPTENAVIYYTLDGSDPRYEAAIRYTAPIVITDYADLRYYAVCIGMNDSSENENLYVINPEATTSDYLTYEQLPADVIENADKYNIQAYDGYQFKNIATVDTISDYEEYSGNGWTADSLEYTNWTAWQDEEIIVDDSRIAFDTDTREVDYVVTSPSYKYSRFVYYVDGEANYSNAEVEGFNGEWEYAEVAQSEGYKLSGFTNGVSYYRDGNGGTWYNRTTSVLTETKTKTQYRSQYALVTFYKWDEETSLTLAPGETREYRTVELYTYDYLKHYVVTLVDNYETEFEEEYYFIVEEGALIDSESVPELYGYTFDSLYNNPDFSDAWNIAADTVTDNITLYPKYTPVKFNVIFAYADGTEIETQSVDYLASANAPETIELPDDYIFTGWDCDDYTCVTGDMVIHARYVLESEYSTVSFVESEYYVSTGAQTKLDAQTSVPGKDIIWSSDNESIAIVDENGVVTGVGIGSTKITAVVEDSNESAECMIIVYSDPSQKLFIMKNSALNIDNNGYIRGLSLSGNPVSSVKNEFSNASSKLYFYDINDNQLDENSKVGTGTTVKLASDLKIVDSRIFIMTGDMTGDGVINNRDVAMMNKYLVNKITPAEYQILAIDVNGDGNINNRDAAMLARYLVGKETL